MSCQQALDAFAHIRGEDYPRRNYAANRPEFDLDCGISDLSVGMFTPQIKNINWIVRGGKFAGHGHFDYTPKLTRMRVDAAAIDGVNLSYVHLAKTGQKENGAQYRFGPPGGEAK